MRLIIVSLVVAAVALGVAGRRAEAGRGPVRAAAAAYLETLERTGIYMPGMAGRAGRDMAITIHGDRATARSGECGPTLELRRRHGRWFVTDDGIRLPAAVATRRA